MEERSNFERMIALATDTFAVQNDPQQLDVDEEIIARLQHLHAATVSEYSEGNGPLIWVLLIPTTHQLMQDFLHKKIGETELLEQTPPGSTYHALYLCSALTLPEYRNQGLTKKLTLKAIQEIRAAHPIDTLFVWNFSQEGEALSHTIAREVNLPLLERTR